MQIPKDKPLTPPTSGQQISPRNRYMIGIKSEPREILERRLTQTERQANWEKGKQNAEQFQAKLKQYLSDKGIAESDFTVEHQSPLGVVIIICSPAVADLIRKMPEVKTVSKDSKNVEQLINLC